MSVVHFLPKDVLVEVPEGTTLLDAARKAAVRVDAPCNGAGTCGKCRARFDAETLQKLLVRPNRKISDEDLSAGWVLLCSTEIHGDVTVVLDENREKGLQILEKGLELELDLQPWISKHFDAKTETTIVTAGHIPIAQEKGDTTDQIFGIAVDIGSTTVVASLLDLTKGTKIASLSALNPQATHAQDVLSRITLGSTPEGLALLHREITSEINRMIVAMSENYKVNRSHIYEIVLAGNTCMLHLVANMDPKTLGYFPYASSLDGAHHVSARSIGIHIAESALAYLPPVVSGFVGADITVGVLATSLAKSQGVTLFVDIGTNGEMVLASDGKMQATSTAAGPAFEGMNIACGMRAGNGAIERVDVDEAGRVHIKTIGNTKAVGICGSGLMDAVALLVRYAVVESSGRFTKDKSKLLIDLRERLADRNGKTVFYLTPDVYLTQGDLRQVQLAKGAVRAGIDVLLARNGLSAAEVDRALIAGSFGYHLTTRSLVDIGLFPVEFDGRVEYVGNTSRTGAEALLLNSSARNELQEIVATIDSVELATDESFTQTFVAAMAFPGLKINAPGVLV